MGEEVVCERSTPRPMRPGPCVPGHSIQQDEEKRCWVIDHTLIFCTLREFLCLGLLIEHVDQVVPFTQFAQHLPEILSMDETEQKLAIGRMRQLLSRLRTKIWPLGLDIISLRGVGYLLLSGKDMPSPDE